nr:hypothetical protein [Liquorilactobacillus satsumensis]
MQILYLQKLNATPKKNKLYPLGFELQDLSHRLISLCPSKTDKFIFISPGYLSTTVKTNQSFIKLLGTNFLGLKTFYLLNTMNGNHRLTKNPHSNSLYTILKNYLTYKNCSVPQLSLKKNFRDHRKCGFWVLQIHSRQN